MHFLLLLPVLSFLLPLSAGETAVPSVELTLAETKATGKKREAFPLSRVHFSVPVSGEKSSAEYRNDTSVFSSGLRCTIRPVSCQKDRIRTDIECRWNMPKRGPLEAASRENDLSAFSISTVRTGMLKGKTRGLGIACTQEGTGLLLLGRGSPEKFPASEKNAFSSGKCEVTLMRSCSDRKDDKLFQRFLPLRNGSGELKEESLTVRLVPKQNNRFLLELHMQETAGKRKDGTPVREVLDASLVFYGPVPGKTVELLKIGSFCRKDHLAFSGERAMQGSWTILIRWLP